MSNLNDVRNKVVHITLKDGVERELRFTLNAMAELEDKYGSVDAAFDALDAGSFKAIRFVLWAALVEDDENLTERQVGSLIDTQSLESLMNDLMKALGNDMPEQGEELPNA